MWIILFNALDDFGVREINEAARIGSPPGHMLPTNYMQIEEMKRKVLDEALHGALRIAGLVSRDARAHSHIHTPPRTADADRRRDHRQAC